MMMNDRFQKAFRMAKEKTYASATKVNTNVSTFMAWDPTRQHQKWLLCAIV